jgi:hypothetical protein
MAGHQKRWQTHQCLRAGELAEQGLEGQLLAFKATNVAHLIVPEAQETFQIVTLQHLTARLQIDRQMLCMIFVNHALGHVDLNAAHLIGEPANGREFDNQVVLDGSTKTRRELLLEGVNTSQGIQCVDLYWAILRGFDVGIPWNLGDFRAAPFNPQGGNYISI